MIAKSPWEGGLYGYVGNDPVNYVDPSGEFFVQAFSLFNVGVVASGGSIYVGVSTDAEGNISDIQYELYDKKGNGIFVNTQKNSVAAGFTSSDDGFSFAAGVGSYGGGDSGIGGGAGNSGSASGLRFGERVIRVESELRKEYPKLFEGINPTFYARSVPFFMDDDTAGLTAPFGNVFINPDAKENSDKAGLRGTMIHELHHVQDGYPDSIRMMFRGTYEKRHDEIFRRSLWMR